MLETVFMGGSIIGFFVIMAYTIIKEVKKHPIIGLFIAIFKGTILATPWFFAWPLTMWFYIWYIFRDKPPKTSHSTDTSTEPDDSGLLEDLLGIRKEPIYDVFGNKVGTASTWGDKVLYTDKFLISPDDVERDPFGDLREK